MNHYETIFIVDLDTTEADQETIFEKLKSMISADGQLILFDDWGTRKFAYEIRKKKQGRYVRLDYCGAGPLVDEMERLFRLDFRILKYMTVLLGQDVDPESLIIVEDEPETKAETAKAETVKTEDVKTETVKAETVKAEDAPSAEASAEEAVTSETTETESATEE
ncbi:MAG: 30S ribosomal protein S6 [Desulfobacteraceae bacterium]|jgi:small subunit ribosomal protein S6|nr:30S ribosomal protein S6 [Desulfobacteraceae bacterium]